uniref:Sperm-associated antigen 8 n=1 Tax=Falco tinnunculus TaxID=100819 RepID=A0A8C4U4C6_FALTI
MGHMPPVYPAERPPRPVRAQSHVLLPEVPMEKPQCHRETPMATAEVPQGMLWATAELPAMALPAVPSAVTPAEAGKDPSEVELPPCHGKQGTRPGKVSPTVGLVLPPFLQMPAGQPSQLVSRGSCLTHNWQKEKATNHLDLTPGQQPGSEASTHWHGHHGLLVHQSSRSTDSTTMKDTYRPPHRARLLGRGEAEKEMLQEICPPRMPMESVSTTHRDYCARGCQFTPLPTTQPHNYYTEQPCSFWLEQAHSLPGVTSIRSRDSPFRRNAVFSTPITKDLKWRWPEHELRGTHCCPGAKANPAGRGGSAFPATP